MSIPFRCSREPLWAFLVLLLSPLQLSPFLCFVALSWFALDTYTHCLSRSLLSIPFLLYPPCFCNPVKSPFFCCSSFFIHNPRAPPEFVHLLFHFSNYFLCRPLLPSTLSLLGTILFNTISFLQGKVKVRPKNKRVETTKPDYDFAVILLPVQVPICRLLLIQSSGRSDAKQAIYAMCVVQMDVAVSKVQGHFSSIPTTPFEINCLFLFFTFSPMQPRDIFFC